MLAIQLDFKVCFAAFLLLFAVQMGLPVCQAANHHCIRGHTVSMELDDFYHNDEILVPQRSTQCKWQFNINSKRKRLNFVLEGLPAKGNGGSEGAYKLHVSFRKRSCNDSAAAGMFCVLPLREGTRQFSVNTDLTGASASSPAKLRVLLPSSKHCARDMLSFHGNCYAANPAPVKATTALGNIKGAAQLASFKSMEEIEAFIAANNARMRTFPYKRPISLKQPVRLGIFYDYKANSGSRLVVLRRHHHDFHPLDGTPSGFRVYEPPTGACASLSVDSKDKPVLKFDDCDTPMPTLLSFPEEASSTNFASDANIFGDADTNFLKAQLRKLQHKLTTHSTVATHGSTTVGSGPSSVEYGQPRSLLGSSGAPTTLLIVGSICVLILLAIVIFFPIFVKRRRQSIRKLTDTNEIDDAPPSQSESFIEGHQQQQKQTESTAIPLVPSTAVDSTDAAKPQDNSTRKLRPRDSFKIPNKCPKIDRKPAIDDKYEAIQGRNRYEAEFAETF